LSRLPKNNSGEKADHAQLVLDRLDSLNFTFQQNEIYQTVYNNNYVSFLSYSVNSSVWYDIYPFHCEGKRRSIMKKILWGALFTLLVFKPDRIRFQRRLSGHVRRFDSWIYYTK
jgi:hypothetical protein